MKSRHIAFFSCALLMAGSLGLVGFTRQVAGEDVNTLPSWMDAQPTIGKLADIQPDEYGSQLSHTNSSCTIKNLYTWGYNPSFGPWRLEYTQQGCFAPTIGGEIAGDYIVPNGVRQAQRLVPDGLGRVSFFSVPGSSRLALVSNSYAYYDGGTPTLHLVDDWLSAFSRYELDSYKNVIRHSDDRYYTFNNADGSPIDIRSNGVTFSANGQWLHAVATNKSQLLINTETHDIVPYANYIDTGGYAETAAASNDGRYVAVAMPYQGMKVFDLQRCSAAGDALQSRNCQSREDIYDQLKTYTGTDDLRIFRLEFTGSSNNLDVSVAVHNQQDGTWKYEKYQLSLPGATVTIKYLAMGDSFGSGEGAFDYVESTDRFVSDGEYNVCHLSRKSYPYLLQKNLQADWFHSVACSGAQSEDVRFDNTELAYVNNGKSQSKVPIPTQQSVIESYKSSLTPGYVPQFNFAAKNNPNIVTMSMGGNDVGFANIILNCVINFGSQYQENNCFSDREEREAKANEVDQKISVWSKNLVDIKNSLGGSDPKVYVIGYPSMMNPDGLCGLNVRFDPSEVKDANNFINYLNTAVKVAADAAGVRYIDVSDAFTRTGQDYRLCSLRTDFAVNGLDLWSIINECASAKAPNVEACPNSFHPNEFGQKLLADTIISRTTNLTRSMPHNSNSTADLIDKRMEFVGDVAITLQNHRITFQKDIAPVLIAKGEKIQINVPKSSDDLPAKSGTATVTAHSTPTVLGQLPISADGTVSGELTLPEDIETGYHRLVVSYTDIADNIVEKYMYFYAAQSQGDWDGDGIDNTSDPCVSVAQSGVDQDGDGIDDACDGEYVKSASTSQQTDPTTNAGNSRNSDSISAGEQLHPKNSNEGLFVTITSPEDIFKNPGATAPLTLNDQLKEDTISDDGNSNLDSEKAGNAMIWLSVGGSLVLLVLVGFVLGRLKS